MRLTVLLKGRVPHIAFISLLGLVVNPTAVGRVPYTHISGWSFELQDPQFIHIHSSKSSTVRKASDVQQRQL